MAEPLTPELVRKIRGLVDARAWSVELCDALLAAWEEQDAAVKRADESESERRKLRTMLETEMLSHRKSIDARGKAERRASEAAANEARLCELVPFVRSCAINWDCDEDAHAHGTPCRGCEAEKLLDALDAAPLSQAADGMRLLEAVVLAAGNVRRYWGHVDGATEEQRGLITALAALDAARGGDHG